MFSGYPDICGYMIDEIAENGQLNEAVGIMNRQKAHDFVNETTK